MIVTGIDLPATAPGGSVELFHDLYTRRGAPLHAESWAWMLGPDQPIGTDLALLDGTGKAVHEPAFSTYRAHLAEQLLVQAPAPDVLHLHHLAFGASPALADAFPQAPALALIHGTDLLYADQSLTQHAVMVRLAHYAQRIIAPTAAMVDLLVRRVPDLGTGRIVQVPWGVPDALLAAPPPRPARGDGGPLRLLYAGRLSPEKGVQDLVAACAAAEVRLSVAAPTPPTEAEANYLGWLERPRLWQEFAHHDLLVVPSARLEAFGLVAVEAQACGLPVLYRQVPGLTDALRDSALGVPDLSARTLATTLSWLASDQRALDQAREAGLRNAAQFPLSATAAALREVSKEIA
ncbi:glycosyltransferase family 4 protein [Nocardiopsis synnemataformans]|uniref:glycosyltransferase family 4 protein n=1 Tax=Nocardiopsis synnemataformans TaxID=61305 RepID=UPI003EB853A3